MDADIQINGMGITLGNYLGQDVALFSAAIRTMAVPYTAVPSAVDSNPFLFAVILNFPYLR